VTTIYDVARAAGVDPSTVSYALSGKGTLSQATRARVTQCAQDLGYRPNQVARSLISRRTKTIGLIIPDICHPFFAEVARAVERSAHERGYRVFVTNTLHDEQLGQELLDDLTVRRVDGVIVAPGGVSRRTIDAARDAGFPLLCCFWEEAKVDVPTRVTIDFEAGGRLAAQHLLSLGHRRIGLVTHLKDELTADHHLRVAGFQRALAERGEPLSRDLVRLGDSSVELGRVAALELLEVPEPPTAIFATNDLMAIGALSAAWARGIQVPADLSVVGFDDIVTAAYTVPPLTTVRVDKVAVMASAVDGLLAAQRDEVGTAPQQLVPTLVVRHSTTRAPA